MGATPELADANVKAYSADTRAEGLAELRRMADRFPESKNVCVLVAQALARDGRQDEAIQYIRERFPDVIRD